MSRGLRLVVVVCLWCMALGLWPAPSAAVGRVPSRAASDPSSPAAQADADPHPQARRLLRLFDFEEARLGNYEDMPQHWYVLGRPANSADPNFERLPLHRELTRRPGYPHFTQVQFDRPQHQPGPHAFHMRLDGGHVGAFLEVGAVPAVPGSEYFISVRVRTADVKNAGARLTAYLVDASGKQIPQSVIRSPRVRSPGQWETLGVTLHGDAPDAAWIGIELELLQPQPDPDSPLGSQQIVLEDIQGQAWWDDVAIWQLPQVSIHTQSRVNILRQSQQPTLRLRVRDVMGSDLLARVELRDATGQLIEQAQRRTGRGRADQWAWTPRLERFGWYTVDLSVHDLPAGQSPDHAPLVARSIIAFLWLPDESPLASDDASKLMILAAGVPDAQAVWLPELLKQSGLAAVTVSLWDERTTPATVPQRQAHLESILTPILMRGGSVSLSFSPLPQALVKAMDMDGSQTPAWLSGAEDQWRPYLLPILMRQGQAVQRWQVGSLRQPLEIAAPDLPEQLRQADRSLRTIAPDPQLVLPWPLDHARRPGLALPSSVYLLDVPVAARAEHLGEYLEPWMQPPASPVWLALREPSPSVMRQADRVTDLALRMVHGWEAGVTGLALDRPWGWATPRQDALMPDALLGVFAQVGRRLLGHRAAGRLTIGPGLRAILFESTNPSQDENAGREGLVVMWNESADDASVAMYLGQSPVRVDLWGNRQPLVELGGVHRLTLSRTPVFIEGVDVPLALMRRSFVVDEPFIESMQTPHHRQVTLANPWPRTISGTVQIAGPQGWRVSPAQSHFSIPAGQAVTLPLQMVFPGSEVAGHKQLTAKLNFMADRPYQVTFQTPVEVGLRDIQFDANVSYHRQADTGRLDAVVTQFVTNTGDRPVSLYAFAQTADFPRQEGIISRLNPGQSIIRRFRFEDVGSQGRRDQPLRVGLRETRGPAVLNQLLRLSPPEWQ